MRANKLDVYQPDSEGDVFLQLLGLWPKWLEEEERKQNHKEFPQIDARWQNFVTKSMCTHTKNVKRYRQLLDDTVWRGLAEHWCQYASGRATFRAHQFTDVAGLFMNSVGLKLRSEQMFSSLSPTAYIIPSLTAILLVLDPGVRIFFGKARHRLRPVFETHPCHRPRLVSSSKDSGRQSTFTSATLLPRH